MARSKTTTNKRIGKAKYSDKQAKNIKPQSLPGSEAKMTPRPIYENKAIPGSGRLQNKVAIITGGDSGIGRAIAIAFAKEGADIVVVYYNEHEDAIETKRLVEEKNQNCLLISGDLKKEKFSKKIVEKTLKKFGKINILVNNAAEQHSETDIEQISAEQLINTFATNFFSYFYLTKAVLPFLSEGDCIINTTSVVAYKGSSRLIDYSATKGAIVTFTRSMSQALVKKGIRVNAVAPGPVWTPLIPASFSKKEIEEFGKNYPMERAAQPEEIAPSYVFLACDDASFMTGQVLHPNGGMIVNG